MDSLTRSELAPNLLLGARVQLVSGVEIGANVVIHDDVTVGSGASIGHGVVLGRVAKLNRGSRRPRPQPEPTVIERDAIICAYALIDAGVRIGRGAMVGDHAGIREGAVIEADAVVGYSSVLNRGARVGRRTRAQAHCIIGPGVVVEEDVFLAPGVQILTGTMNTMSPRPPGRSVEAAKSAPSAVSREPRRVRLVEELLAGKPVDPGEVAPGFNFDSWHIAAIATDKSAVEAVGWLAKVADRRLMQVRRDEHSVWAWLAGSRKLESTELQLLAAKRLPADGCIAFGEPQEGLSGWQLSHHQAAAALRVGVRRGDRLVHHGEVAKQASMLQDPVFAASLRQRYLVPLERDADGGTTARMTLRTYFSRERNSSATAEALGIARQTVGYRLRAIKERLGVEDLYACAAELEAALDLDRFDRREHAPGP